MYAVGAKVVHPCYGAGRIVRVQEMSIGNDSRSYYVIEAMSKSMQLMVPVQRAGSVGLREIGGLTALEDALAGCSVAPSSADIPSDLRERQEAMRERLKSGSFDAAVDVVRELHFMSKRRPLGTVDRELFDLGKDLLAGELALALDQKLTEAMQVLEDLLGQMGLSESA
ncbi:MAG: CarD family transcriptional regulator [Anaerolineae bacterium]